MIKNIEQQESNTLESTVYSQDEANIYADIRSPNEEEYFELNEVLQNARENNKQNIIKRLIVVSEALNYPVEAVMWALQIIKKNHRDKDAFLNLAKNLEKIDAKQLNEHIITCYRAYCSLYFDQEKRADKNTENYLYDEYGLRMNKHNRDSVLDKIEIKVLTERLKKNLLQ